MTTATLTSVLILSSVLLTAAAARQPIDRHALVSRHNPVLTSFSQTRPLSVGNGEFAFNVDLTGLQTFVPFNTMSHWAWHAGSPPAGTKISDYQETLVETHGRQVPYPLPDPAHPQISDWLAGSPHAINLGKVALVLTKKDRTPATQSDLKDTKQVLDLWRGLITSHFTLEGIPVTVETASHPTLDSIAVRIDSPLIKEGRLAISLACPGNNPVGFTDHVGDWSSPAPLEALPNPKPGRADFKRQMDEHVSYISLAWDGPATLQASQPAARLEIINVKYGAQDKWVDITAKLLAAGEKSGRLSLHIGNDLAGDPILKVKKSAIATYKLNGVEHQQIADEGTTLVIDAVPHRNHIILVPDAASTNLSFTCTFSPTPIASDIPDAAATLRASDDHWATYWKSGGAIDLSQSTDPRWHELERRIVLSQYLMAVHEAGSLPPQESGLVNNGWFGRFHMEMYTWHAAHWALWNHWPQLNRSLNIYDRLLPSTTALAKRQGYQGARWPKCIANDLREWPHEIHSFLIWQQPHPIFFAELDYRAHPTRETLQRWQGVVDATADFMATYAFLDPKTNQYVLGPPIHLASENSPPYSTRNPTFELGYWRFGLRTAQLWRTRMNLPPRQDWDKVLSSLTPLPTQDGLYVLHEDVQDMWTKWNFEHPALVATLGILPGDGVDPPTMQRTIRKIASTWNWQRTWGWDFPMLAMTAARTGDPKQAIDFLLTAAPGFQFDQAGLATGGPYPYFPSNGALLYAVAMMAQGWDGAPNRPAPGFPTDGTWKVRYENLATAP